MAAGFLITPWASIIDPSAVELAVGVQKLVLGLDFQAVIGKFQPGVLQIQVGRLHGSVTPAHIAHGGTDAKVYVGTEATRLPLK